MPPTKHINALLVSIFFLWGLSSFAQELPDKPIPPRLVVDYAGVLNRSETNHLEQKLVAFNDTTSNQIAVVIIKSLNGLNKEVFADRLGEKWGVGRKGKDNGILILIKPKRGNERGQVRISVGYGLEGAVPDALTKRIIEQEMIPYFENNDYFTGLDRGTDVIMALSTGEFTADEYAAKSGSPWAGLIVPIIVIIIIFMLMRRNSRKYYSTGGQQLPFWTALWLGSTMSRHGQSGSWGSFNSGSGGFGGGFGGFGGGSFGGGGAGGSW